MSVLTLLTLLRLVGRQQRRGTSYENLGHLRFEYVTAWKEDTGWERPAETNSSLGIDLGRERQAAELFQKSGGRVGSAIYQTGARELNSAKAKIYAACYMYSS